MQIHISVQNFIRFNWFVANDDYMLFTNLLIIGIIFLTVLSYVIAKNKERFGMLDIRAMSINYFLNLGVF